MKYDHKKIKREHGVMKEFEKTLKIIASRPCITRIIPGRIARKQSSQSTHALRFSYTTPSGLKCTMVKGGTRQELFIITSDPNMCQKLLVSSGLLDKSGVSK